MQTNTINSDKMPWDGVWDFSHYRTSRVRIITKRYKINNDGEGNYDKYKIKKTT